MACPEERAATSGPWPDDKPRLCRVPRASREAYTVRGTIAFVTSTNASIKQLAQCKGSQHRPDLELNEPDLGIQLAAGSLGDMRLQVLGTLAIILGCLALGVDVYLDRVILEFYVPTVPGRHGIHASDAIGSTLVIAGLVALWRPAHRFI